MNKSFLGIQSKTGEMVNEQNTEFLQDFLDSWLDVNDKRFQAKLISREEFQKKVKNGESLVEESISDNNISIYFPETNTHKVYPLLDEVRNLTVWNEKTITKHKNHVDDKYRFMGKVAYYLRDLDGLREEINLTEEESGNLELLVRFFENIAKQIGDVEITDLSNEDKKEVEKYLVGENIAEKIYPKEKAHSKEKKKSKITLQDLKKRKIKQYLKILTYANKKTNQENTKNSLIATFAEKHQEVLAKAQNMSFSDFNKIVHDEGIMYTADNLTLGKIKEGLESDKNEDDLGGLFIRKIFNSNFIKKYGAETTVKEVIDQIMEGYSEQSSENKFEKIERLEKIIQLTTSIGAKDSESMGHPSYTLDTGLQQCVMATSFLKVLEDYNINYLPINPIGHVCALVEIDDTVYWCEPIGGTLKQLTDEDFRQSEKEEIITIELLKKYLQGKKTKSISFRLKEKFDANYSNHPILVGDKHKLLSGSLQNNLGILYAAKYQETGDEEMFKLAEKYYSLVIENNDISAYNNLGILYAAKYQETGDEEMFKLAEKYYNLAIENKDTGAYLNLGNLYFEKGKRVKNTDEQRKYFTLAKEKYQKFIDEGKDRYDERHLEYAQLLINLIRQKLKTLALS